MSLFDIHVMAALNLTVSQGNDIVHASIDYTIGANIESLILDGSANLAGAGNSTNNALGGNSGDNKLDGRGGQDFLTGNGGNDTFEFQERRGRWRRDRGLCR